jgi:ankyrin repeat protein
MDTHAGGQSPWHLAAAAGHAGVLQAMVGALRAVPLSALQGITVSETETVPEAIARAVQRADAKDLTPLHMACIKGHAQAAAVLMDAGANPFAMVHALAWGVCVCLGGGLDAAAAARTHA